MNPILDRLLGEATRLTRSGNLREATVAIQAALRQGLNGQSAPPANRTAQASPPDETCVIDVEARELPAGPAPEPVPGPVRKSASAAREPTCDGDFIAASYTDSHGRRDYKLYLPPGHAGQSLPLVVMLHGCTQNPDDFAAGTRMNDTARAQGFIVLYPAQATAHNPSGCWNWFKHNHQRRGAGEPALLAGMTRHVIEQHGIDPSRVFVAGLSAGGAMAAILGDTYPELFTAVGVHSGLPAGAATDMATAFTAMRNGHCEGSSAPLRALRPGARTAPARIASAPPTIVFHGDRDTTVHPKNGEQVVQACVSSSGVASHSGVREEHRLPSNGRVAVRRVYREADGRVRAEHWAIEGAGHAWSGGSTRGSFADEQGPDATREMVRFFLAVRPVQA